MFSKLRGGIRYLLENSLFLVGGAALALVWANYGTLASYAYAVHELHFWVNDVGMALFFLVAAKEIRESRLPGGDLYDGRTAAMPIIATLGGVVGPALIFVFGAQVLDPAITDGWAVPTATDIAFSYLMAKVIFGRSHPGTTFLLTLAVADDAIGLFIIAIIYPQGDISPAWFVGLSIAALGITWVMNHKLKIRVWAPYVLIPGVISWFGFYKGGIHPALGLAPIVAFMPHAHTDKGLYSPAEAKAKDTLNRMTRWLRTPVEIILGFFGFVNAGILITQDSFAGAGLWLVLGGLAIGKPVGICLFAGIGKWLFKLTLPEGMTWRHMFVMSMMAAIGFTVAIFVSVAAFPAGATQDSLKMGALLSLGCAAFAWIAATILRVKTPTNSPYRKEKNNGHGH